MVEMKLITNPNENGVYAIYHKNIYEFICDTSSCKWETLEQKLEVSRDDYVAMLVPDELVTCNKKK